MRRAEGASERRAAAARETGSGRGHRTRAARKRSGGRGQCEGRGGVGVATAHKQHVKGRVGVASARVGEWVWPLRMRSAGRREEAAKASLAGAI